METMLRDLRHGVRMLVQSPGFAAIAILTLALGIGANTALFSVVNGVLLNPLPFAQPDRLVAIYARDPDFAKSSISYPNFLDWQRDNRSYTAIAAFREDDFNLLGMGQGERVKVEMVSSDFFPVLGVNPVIGRQFRAPEDQLGAGPVALISEGFWERKFGGSPKALGKTLNLNGKLYTIVGVIPASFQYHSGNFHQSDVFVPIGQWSEPTFRDRRVADGMDAVGRLAPGVTLAQAKADMDGVAQHLAEEYPEADKATGITLVPLRQDVVGDIRPFLLVLLAAVGFVLLIACANVANLLLARSTGRSREFAIRVALGATQWRMLRQLLTESLLLSLAGGGLGLLAAAWGTQAGLKLLPEALPRAEAVHVDGRVLLFTLAVSLLAGVFFGLAPALKICRGGVHERLKEGGRGSSGTRYGAQRVFVIVEMALAVVLLVGAGLMIRSLAKLLGVNPGFDPANVLTFGIGFPPSGGLTPDSLRAYFVQIHDKLASVPGVQAASLIVGALPMASDSELGYWVEGQPKPTTDAGMKEALLYAVQPDYLKVMRIPLERGRFLTSADNEHSPFVIVIDERFARLTFGDRNPIGQRINFVALGGPAEIVGVVGHVKQWGLATDSNSPVQAQFYLPMAQIPDRFMTLLQNGSRAVIRTQGSPLAAVGAIREAMTQINSQMVVYDTETMSGIISDSLTGQRFSMILLGVFAALALLLASIGIYGVISYGVGQRIHEMGIRMALGARRTDVLRLVLGQGAKMALVGVGIGLLAALGLTRLMARLLFGVSTHDPESFLGVAALLVLVALAACYLPARRATRIHPATALRYE